MKRAKISLLAITAITVGMLISCNASNSQKASEDVDIFYSQLNSDSFKAEALRKGFKGWEVTRTDSDIVTRITLPDDWQFSSRVASETFRDMQCQQTISNYLRIIERDSVAYAGFKGLRDLGMKYRAVYYDHRGDSVVFKINPEDVVGSEK